MVLMHSASRGTFALSSHTDIVKTQHDLGVKVNGFLVHAYLMSLVSISLFLSLSLVVVCTAHPY